MISGPPSLDLAVARPHVTRMLPGYQLPVVQAPMAGAQASALAIAVARAGGVGSLPAAMLTRDALVRELTALRDAGVRANVNFFCHTPPTPEPARENEWRAALRPYYHELGLDPDPGEPVQAPSRTPFDDAAAEILEVFKPPIVSFHFGLPDARLLARVRATGACVWSTATTVEEAVHLESSGVDVVIAQGLEAGGHRGHFLHPDVDRQLGTLALVAQVTRAVRVPVIAAGGIGDARGVRAVLALGAVGAQVGTAYLLSDEATTSSVHRAALASPDARHTALTNLFSGRLARGIVNRLMREIGPVSALAPAFPLASVALAPLRAAAEAKGRGDFSPLWAGQDTSGCRAAGAAEITRALAGQLERGTRRATPEDWHRRR